MVAGFEIWTKPHSLGCRSTGSFKATYIFLFPRPWGLLLPSAGSGEWVPALLNVDGASGSIPACWVYLTALVCVFEHQHRLHSPDVGKVGGQWAQKREITENREQQQRKWGQKQGHAHTPGPANAGVLPRSSQDPPIWRQAQFETIPSWTPSWFLEGKITAFGQGDAGQLTHAKRCILDGSPRTSEIRWSSEMQFG